MLYAGQAPAPASVDGGGSSLVGASFGFNIGSETFRIQLAIAGLLVLAVAVLLWMHARGHRFSVKVD